MDGGVLTRTEFAMFNSRRQEAPYLAASAGLVSAHAERTREFLSGLPFWAVPLIYVSLVIGSLAFRFGQALLYGNIGMFFARQLKADIDYRAAAWIAAVAVTPSSCCARSSAYAGHGAVLVHPLANRVRHRVAHPLRRQGGRAA